MESEKSVDRERRMNPRSEGEGSGYGEWGREAAIRRHIRLDEPRITTRHLSARHAFSGSCDDARGG